MNLNSYSIGFASVILNGTFVVWPAAKSRPAKEKETDEHLFSEYASTII